MTTLHMDVESARSTQANIKSTHDQVLSEVGTITSAVQGMVGSVWLGNSATEFLNEYENWRSSMNTMLEALNTLGNRLQSEIAEWETMASKLA
jgi:WXG100 family type VII secretion target